MRLSRMLRIRITRNGVLLTVLFVIAFVLFINIQSREGSTAHRILANLYAKLYDQPHTILEFEQLKQVERKKADLRNVNRPDWSGDGAKIGEPSKFAYCNVYEPPRVDESFVQTNFRTSKGLLPIFVHDMNDELSRSLMQKNSWEPATVTYVVYTLQNDGDLHFIDLGANLGVYTVAVAAMNRRVVAVEPNLVNAKRLRKTVLENGMANLVTIVLNAVSDKRETVRIASPSNNIGGGKMVRVAGERFGFIDAKAADSKQNEDLHEKPSGFVDDIQKRLISDESVGVVDMSDAVFTVTMDDLLEVVTFSRAIMKMDIEGSEAAALRNASKLFDEVDIPIVLFEWASRSDEDAAFIKEFFYDRGYLAYTNPYSDAPLLDRLTWPWDIVWRRSGKPRQPSKSTVVAKVIERKPQKQSNATHCNVYQSEVRENFPLTVLHTALGECGIYTYDESDSISHSIMTTGLWEPNQIGHLLFVLGADPQLQLVDIGCNLGVYTLVAAMRGRRVVAVDANVANLRRLRKSVWLNHYDDRVTLVWNAITDRRGDSVKMILVDKNVGGSFVVPQNASLRAIKHSNDNEAKDTQVRLAEQSVAVDTITMDDLLEVVTFQRAVVKIDIEGDEVRALRGASRFFDTLDIPIVYFEWGVTSDELLDDDDSKDTHKSQLGSGGVGRSSEERKWILEFFASRSYQPFADPRHAKPLTEKDSPWPFDIVFMRKKSPLRQGFPTSTTKAASAKKVTKKTPKKNSASIRTINDNEDIEKRSVEPKTSRVKKLQRPRKLWNITVLPVFNVTLSVEERFLFRPLSLKVSEREFVRIYGFYEPDIISNALAAANEWESLQLHAMMNVLRNFRNLNLIDIGCNIGIYTMAAAKLGRRVLAVDASEASLLRLRVAAIEEGFEKRVTLVHNAIFDSYVLMKLMKEQGNMGGNRVWPVSPFYNVTKRDILAHSVLLDDLLEAAVTAGIRKAVLKIDIEGNEVQALRFADRLFDGINIPVVFMEWGKVATMNFGVESEVRAFMRRRSYSPFAYFDATIPLPDSTVQWPWNVVWKKNDTLTPVLSA